MAVTAPAHPLHTELSTFSGQIAAAAAVAASEADDGKTLEKSSPGMCQMLLGNAS